jgi:hypothetical protein
LVIGFSVRRQVQIARSSSSEQLRSAVHGIGGAMGRDAPMRRPVRIARMKMSSVQIPRPVLASGVRLAGYQRVGGVAIDTISG